MASASTSAGYLMPTSDEFVPYKPPTSRLAFRRDKRYHVFLSFRGPDVRNTLVAHLYQALCAAGLYVFIDSDKLEKGEIIELSLERAIESSAICIPIFSKDYAGSIWCLKEAAAMLSTPDLIIPLFYHLNPTHVRYPLNDSSPYKQSFEKYSTQVRYPREEIDGWKDALLEICKRSGWTLDDKGDEAQLVKMVVNDLNRTFGRTPLPLPKHPVGMERVKNALIHKLNLNSMHEVVKVGIWGLGGFGKTAIAKAVYNQIYPDFEVASFVLNVRVNAADHKGLPKLQRQILKDLTNYEDKVCSVDHGESLFMDRLGGKHVLLILDDVDPDGQWDAVVQLKALAGNWLERVDPRSRVIITSRNKHVLDVAGVSKNCIYEMRGLDRNEGLELFSNYAFRTKSPSPGYEDLSEKIVEACKGHPLSLEIMGSYLSHKQNNLGCWTEAALNDITGDLDIRRVLYISYNSLSNDEKEIFVDIACFFIGECHKNPTLFWKSLYKKVDSALCNLSDKLLIKIDNQGVFDMHDLLRDMGRNIAEEEKDGIRLWEAAHLSTAYNNNLSHLRINGGNPQRLDLLCRPGLRYLHLQNLLIKGMTEDTLALLPPSLIWLRLENCSFSIGMDRAIKQPRDSRLEDNIWQLKIVQLNSCHGNDNHSISSLFSLPIIKLQHLELRGCRNINSLPDTVGNLSQLQHWDLEGCVKLEDLPNNIGKLSQLKHLNLRGCRNLNNLPDTVGNLSQLQHLDLEGCVKLNNLPDTIDKLSNLEYLSWKDGKNVMFI
ncbi:disease resistance protein RUN1 [Cryptomeria japonica]|uniref:disease resistance protein RUN1 n=1 Tax=Cryptomeria japonica TaxID=3369 RepID=UPI0025AD0138|nr:disease resistance protein RUN1 [Cryptomeria japonica]